MNAKYFAILTSQGTAKLANATALGTKLNLTQMAVGDGNGTLPTPDPAQTRLLNQKRIAPLNMLTVDPANTSQIIAEQIIPENEGGFWIREIGLYDDAGVLIAVANCPETYKPQLQEGSGRTQTIRMILIVSSTEAVTLKIDPSVVLATRKYVDDKVIEVKAYADALMAAHLAAADPHSQYATKASPALTGTPNAPTPVKTDNTTRLATTAHVKQVVADYAPLANPALTGKPTAPTAAQTSNDTQLATTAFVKDALAALVDSSPEALDTLNELAAALGDDPNFAATMTAELARKMDKDRNGADIPDVAEFLENLGLGGAAKLNVGTTAGTVAAGDDSRLNSVLGVGQTWQLVTASRTPGVTYTNSTGRPIFVSVTCRIQPQPSSTELYISGVLACTFYKATSSDGAVSGVVPDGAEYSIKISSGNISNWAELR